MSDDIIAQQVAEKLLGHDTAVIVQENINYVVRILSKSFRRKIIRTICIEKENSKRFVKGAIVFIDSDIFYITGFVDFTIESVKVILEPANA